MCIRCANVDTGNIKNGLRKRFMLLLISDTHSLYRTRSSSHVLQKITHEYCLRAWRHKPSTWRRELRRNSPKNALLSVLQLWASHLLYIEMYLCSLYSKYIARQFASNHLLRETFEWVLHLFSIANWIEENSIKILKQWHLKVALLWKNRETINATRKKKLPRVVYKNKVTIFNLST